MTSPPLLIVGHGTRSDDGVAEFTRFVERVGSLTGDRIPAVAGGFIELSRPSVADAVTRLTQAAAPGSPIGRGPARPHRRRARQG